jgi:hypothetical protein
LKRNDADLSVLNLGRGEVGDMKKLCFDVAIETGKGSHFDPSTMIDEREIITICISYPLRYPTIINMQSEGGWTAKAFAGAVCDIYRDIYAEHNPPRSYSGHGISDCSPSIANLVLKGAERLEGGIWNALVETVA